MKKSLLLLVVAVFALTAFSASLTDLFKTSKTNNRGYVQSSLNFELASLDYDKAIIEAPNKKSELAAQTTYQNSQLNFQKGVSSFYNEITDAYFLVKIADITSDIATMQYQQSKIEFNNAKNTFAKKLISESVFKETEITFLEAENNYKKAKNEFDRAVKNFKKVTGIEYTELEIKVPDYKKLKTSLETFKKNDFELASLLTNLEMTKIDLNTLADISSNYEKRNAEIKVVIAEQNYNLKLSSMDEDYSSELLKLDSLNSSLNHSKIKFDLKAAELRDFDSKYKKGLISEKDMLTYRINYTNALKTYNESLREYLKETLTFMIANGVSVEEAAM